MEELRAIVASNLIRLRTGAGMTQAELGQMLNYSDKTVSKWERAESMPDAYVLLQLSRIFGITVDELLSSQTTWKTQKELKREQRVVTYDTRAIILVSLAGLWTLALLIFVVFWLLGQVLWQVFPCAVPISLIVYLVLHSIWGRGRYNRYIIMALILSLLVMIYLLLLRYNLWQIFLLALPAEIIVYLSFRIRVRDGENRWFGRKRRAKREAPAPATDEAGNS